MENSIRNMDTYVTRMKKSLLDKMFFVDKIFEPVENIIDFGCANGELIRAMRYLFPEYQYIGYDINQKMITLARQTVPEVSFYTNWDEIAVPFSDSLLNISSTVHEVHSYGSEESIAQFWQRVFGSGFQYIAIRDMMLSEDAEGTSSNEDYRRVSALYPERLAEFEKIWGSIHDRHNLIHYLLKYTYTENWPREVAENYFPITVEQLLAKIPPEYEVVYSEHYVLPYIAQQVKRDCGVIIPKPTHFKILLKRKFVEEK